MCAYRPTRFSLQPNTLFMNQSVNRAVTPSNTLFTWYICPHLDEPFHVYEGFKV